MSDLAAVRIHSKTMSIFSSRPIISRNRCTDGDWSSVDTVGAALEEVVEQVGHRVVRRPRGHVAGRRAGNHEGHAEVGQLADAVVDVQPEAPERLHQRLDVEALVRPRAQVAEDPGPEGRLHKRAKTCLGVRRLGRPGRGRSRGARAGAPGAEGQIVHCWR